MGKLADVFKSKIAKPLTVPKKLKKTAKFMKTAKSFQAKRPKGKMYSYGG